MSAIEALYIFDEHNNLILNHTYTSQPPTPSTLLSLYLAHPTPRPSLLHLPSTSPPTTCYSILHCNLLFLSPSSTDTEPLLVLEFLHRVADALEEFLGSPLLASRVTGAYDVVAQVVGEIADAGVPCCAEPNALRDVVETGPGMMANLLGIGASARGGAVGGAGPGGVLRPPLQQPQSAQGSAVPWRRSNVRHTSNELYVDVVESLAVVLAPSGRPLSAFAHGSIAFNSKVSGVPDLLLNLSTGGKGGGMGGQAEQLGRVMERVVFHPCVRLKRWKDEGVVSFVPPDGRFVLGGYEVDLLGPDAPLTTGKASTGINLPATLEVNTNLGPHGSDFEVRITPTTSLTNSSSAATASLQSNLSTSNRSAAASNAFKSGGSGDSKGPALDDVAVHIPIPAGVRNIPDLRPSRGEAHWSPADGRVEWRVPAKDFGPGGAVLRCTVQGPLSEEEGEEVGSGVLNGAVSTSTYDYTDDEPYQSGHAGSSSLPGATSSSASDGEAGKAQTKEKMKELMPTSAALSFSVKGWLPSGLKVESLLLDHKRSRGLGPEVKPYKGVKYVAVSRGGVEVRC